VGGHGHGRRRESGADEDRAHGVGAPQAQLRRCCGPCRSCRCGRSAMTSGRAGVFTSWTRPAPAAALVRQLLGLELEIQREVARLPAAGARGPPEQASAPRLRSARPARSAPRPRRRASTASLCQLHLPVPIGHHRTPTSPVPGR
jgi:hypothetical protein